MYYVIWYYQTKDKKNKEIHKKSESIDRLSLTWLNKNKRTTKRTRSPPIGGAKRNTHPLTGNSNFLVLLSLLCTEWRQIVDAKCGQQKPIQFGDFQSNNSQLSLTIRAVGMILALAAIILIQFATDRKQLVIICHILCGCTGVSNRLFLRRFSN